MEEDIKRAIKELRGSYELKHRDWAYNCLDTIEKGLEQLEKENISKQKAYDDCYCEFKHYKQFDSIPKSVIRDKIEELDNDREEAKSKYYFDYQSNYYDFINGMKKSLKEILGED